MSTQLTHYYNTPLDAIIALGLRPRAMNNILGCVIIPCGIKQHYYTPKDVIHCTWPEAECNNSIRGYVIIPVTVRSPVE